MQHALASGPQSLLFNKVEDLTSERGAQTLAARIRAYWGRRGQWPLVRVEPTFITDSGGVDRKVFQVRSNMVGGRPL